VLRLHDTALGRVVDVEPRDPGKFSIYVCGPTVYDYPHLGHGRMALVWDILRRYLEWTGIEVAFVSNVTDVDDNIINRANDEGVTTDDVVAKYEKAWWDAVDALGVKRPTHDPHASQYIAGMIDAVASLIERGHAYETSDGVYFDSSSIEGYGLLAHQSIDSLRTGARVDVNEEKRSPVDFVLWKKAKPGEPVWKSPWGDGRPGWHTECVVMSLGLLGEGFDLHTGGMDLTFPHHENERAQAVALGREFSRHWAHHAFIEVGGEKMSKSLGNFTTLTDLLAMTDARSYRMLVLQAHYRSPVEVTPDTIDQAVRTLRRIDEFVRNAAGLPEVAAAPDAMARFRERMDDDMDTPNAVSVLFDSVTKGNIALTDGRRDEAATQLANVREIAGAVGLELTSESDEIPPEIVAMVAERDAARAAKDFATSDRLRDDLQSLGWTVKDTPAGTQVHR
jgi:cysteinyl-tRNA synthetase